MLDRDDPFAHILRPPPDETAEQRDIREREEARQRETSRLIDLQIKAERAALKKRGRPVKLLLLGQSESGKSTLIKNFQLTYAKENWLKDRDSWTTIVHFNIVRSVNRIVEAIREEDTNETQAFSNAHSVLCLRLAPLHQIQSDLERILGASSQEVTASGSAQKEFGVRSKSGWNDILPRHRQDEAGEGDNLGLKRIHMAKEAAGVINSCLADMQALWNDSTVQALLRRRGLRLKESSGFFLDDLNRICRDDYVPSDNDILRARLRTIGVQEHRFLLDEGVMKGPESGQEWIIYDVEGTRSSRAAWSAFFDDVDAICFLAPVSCFDEWLLEDENVNRLQDSYTLWKGLCSNRILAKVRFILFLNKCDLLKQKLEHTQLATYIPSYKGTNDFPAVAKYFRAQFAHIIKKESPDRLYNVHLTSAIDTNSTQLTLHTIKDQILRRNFADAGFAPPP